MMTWFYISSVHFLPYILLFYLNTGLILTVLKASKQRSSLRCISRSFKSLSATQGRIPLPNVNKHYVNNVSSPNVNNNKNNIDNNCCNVAPLTTTNNKNNTKQKIAKFLGFRNSSSLKVEAFQMKENHHYHHHHHHHHHDHHHHNLLPSIHRLQNSIQQQTSLDSDSSQINQSQARTTQIESRLDYNCFEVTSPPRPCNSAILYPQTQGKCIKLFPRRCTNLELYIFASPNRNLSCLSLPGDSRQRRISTFCQGVPIHNSTSLPRQHNQRLACHSNYFSSEQMRMTVTCISIICLFLVCIIPSAFSNRPIAKALFGKDMTMIEFTRGKFYNRLRTATNFLVYCNLSLNFVVYCVFNHRFLVTLRRLVDLRLQSISSACRHGDHESRTSLLCSALISCRWLLYRGDASGSSTSSRCGVCAGSNFDFHRHRYENHLPFRRESEAAEIPSDSSIVGTRRLGYGFRRNRSVDCGSANFDWRRGTHANGCHSE